MAAPLRMARAALLFVVVVIAMDPGAHGFITNPGGQGFAASEGGSTAAELKALSAQVSRLEEVVANVSTVVLATYSLVTNPGARGSETSEGGSNAEELSALSAQVSRLEGVVADVNTAVLALAAKPLEAPVGTTSLGNGLTPGTERRQLEADESSDGEEGNCGILCLPPSLIGAMQDLQMILPLDWECQTGTAGGVYPCPKGRPSTCSLSRHSHDLGEKDGVDGVSESCAACFCLLNDHICCKHIGETTEILTSKCNRDDACGGGDEEGWKESVDYDCSSYASMPDWCTKYPDTLGMDPHASTTVLDACAVCRSPDDKCYSKTYDVPHWEQQFGGYTCSDYKKNPSWCTTYSDKQDWNGIKVVEACAVCRPKRAFGSCSSEVFGQPAWSSQWWEDTDAGRSYINFKITRYEMSPNFGVEFYSTEGDTVRIFPNGEVHFKPVNSERSLVVNENVVYNMGGNEAARARVLSTDPQKRTLHAPDLSLPLTNTQIQQLRADLHSGQGPEHSPRRELFGFGGIMTSGSFMQMGSGF